MSLCLNTVRQRNRFRYKSNTHTAPSKTAFFLRERHLGHVPWSLHCIEPWSVNHVTTHALDQGGVELRLAVRPEGHRQYHYTTTFFFASAFRPVWLGRCIWSLVCVYHVRLAPWTRGSRTAASCQPQAWKPSAIPVHHRRSSINTSHYTTAPATPPAKLDDGWPESGGRWSFEDVNISSCKVGIIIAWWILKMIR